MITKTDKNKQTYKQTKTVCKDHMIEEMQLIQKSDDRNVHLTSEADRRTFRRNKRSTRKILVIASIFLGACVSSAMFARYQWSRGVVDENIQKGKETAPSVHWCLTFEPALLLLVSGC